MPCFQRIAVGCTSCMSWPVEGSPRGRWLQHGPRHPRLRYSAIIGERRRAAPAPPASAESTARAALAKPSGAIPSRRMPCYPSGGSPPWCARTCTTSRSGTQPQRTPHTTSCEGRQCGDAVRRARCPRPPAGTRCAPRTRRNAQICTKPRTNSRRRSGQCTTFGGWNAAGAGPCRPTGGET